MKKISLMLSASYFKRLPDIALPCICLFTYLLPRKLYNMSPEKKISQKETQHLSNINFQGNKNVRFREGRSNSCIGFTNPILSTLHRRNHSWANSPPASRVKKMQTSGHTCRPHVPSGDPRKIEFCRRFLNLLVHNLWKAMETGSIIH